MLAVMNLGACLTVIWVFILISTLKLVINSLKAIKGCYCYLMIKNLVHFLKTYLFIANNTDPPQKKS